MREKILAELKKKYSGLSNELLGLIADKLSVKITTDDQLQGGLAELDNSPIPVADYAAFLQREGDRRVSLATQTHERTLREKFEFKEKTPAPGGPTPPKTENEDDLRTQMAALQRKLQDREAKEQRQELQNQFVQKLTEKKIPVAFARGRSFESAEQLDAALAEVEKDYTEVRQSLVNEGLGQQSQPFGGAVKTDNVDADIDAWATAKK